MKERAAVAWSAGAFENVAGQIHDMHAALVEALGPQPGERVLDIACGAGNVSELAAGAGARVTGIDLSPRLVEVAKERAASGGFDIDYRVGDAERLDVEDGSLDANFGPITLLLEGLDPGRRAEFERAMLELTREAEQPDGRIVEEREYLLVSGTRR